MGLGASKMPETGIVPGDLDPTLLDSLPQDLREKVIEQYNEYQRKYDELQTSHEHLRVDSEQRYFELERNFMTSNEKLVGNLEVETKSAHENRERVENLEQKLKESSALTEELQKKKDAAEAIARELDSTRSNVEIEKTQLAQAVDRKTHEIDTLNEAWKEMSDKLAKVKSESMHALAEKEQIETQMISIQHREQRLQQENGLMTKQNEWFEQELKTKVDELLNVRREQSSRLLECEVQVEHSAEEVRHLEGVIETLKESNEKQAQTIEGYCEKLKEMRDMHTQQEEQHGSHVHSQSKLIDLYKTSAADAEAQVKELTSAVTELQNLLKLASAANGQLEKDAQSTVSEHVDTIKAKDEEISRMEKELQHANELLEVARKKGNVSMTAEAIEALSPSAAAASRLLKSGMTLTQIYSEYVNASEQLLVEQQENERLQQYLDKILEEIEEKAPLMKRQREDYEKSITVIDKLTRQLDTARLEEEKLRVGSDDGRRKVLHITRENQRLKQQTTDLSQQVRMLLKELEEARGTVVSLDVTKDANISVDEVSSSSHIISEKLVTFRGIGELQKKNQELIAALRNLSDEREEAEQMAMDTRTADLKRQVDTVSEQLAMMREARDRQVTMVDALVRQRDMYRVLLSESGSMVLPATPTPLTSTPVQQKPADHEKPVSATPVDNSRELSEKTAALKELMEEFNQYREEKNKSETMLTEQIEKFRKDNSDKRVQNAQLASQLDFGAERLKVLQNNAESYKKEIAALRDKNQNYSGSVIRHEQTINSLKQDLIGVKERLSRAEMIGDNLRVERNMLKSVEARLIQEKETSMREQSGQRLLLTNLQAIQKNLERSDFENKTRLNQRIENLEKQDAGLKRKLEGIDAHYRSIMTRLEHQLAEVQKESERRSKSGQTMQTQLEQSQRKTQGLIDQAAELRGKLDKANEEITKLSAEQPKPTPAEQEVETLKQAQNMVDDEVKHFRNQLDTVRAELKTAKSQLEQARQHTEQYKTMATSMELSLKEQTETTRHFKETTETNLKDSQEGNEKIEKQLMQVEKERQNLINENFKLTETYHKSNAELQKQLQILQSEIEEAYALKVTAFTNEQAARSDHANLAALAQEAQDKYERELMLHAADVEALTNVKKRNEGFSSQITAAEDKARDASNALTSAKSGWTEQERHYQSEDVKLKLRITELQEQNRMVHEEMETMVHNHQQQERNKSAVLAQEVMSDQTTDRSIEQLMEVIRFLRKEKEISEARLDVTKAESTRLKQRTEHLGRQIEETNKALNEERQNAQVNLATASHHMELLRKVDNLNLVTESNKLLRGERDQFSLQLRECETKAKKLEEDIAPLQAANREMTAERDVLTTEKTALTAEVERWRARTNHLIEQCNKTDPEEHKRLLQERLTLQKKISIGTEETHKLRADISRLNTSNTNLQGELVSMKQETETKNVAHLKMTKELNSKNSIIVQLRKVGRKYKMEVQELVTEVASLKTELASLRAELATVSGGAGAVTVLEEKLKKIEAELALVTEKLGSSDYEKNEASKTSKEFENRCKMLEDTLEKTTEELKKAAESDSKLEATNKSLQEQVNKQSEDYKKLKDLESKSQQLRNTITSAKTKIISQKAEVEKLTGEALELKRKNVELTQSAGEANAKKAAYESRIGALERELNQLKNSLASSQADSQQLQQKITVLQKQLEIQQKPQQVTTPKPTVSASPVAGHRHTGPKAPMATVSIQPFPVQPVRRITVVPTPPTATVMPTSQSASEGEMASPSSSVRPTPPVQTVSPHIETEAQEPAEPIETEAPEPQPEPTPSTSSGRETGPPPPHGASKRTRDSADSSDTEQEGPVKRPKTLTTQEVEGTAQEVTEVREAVTVAAEVQPTQQEDSQPPKEVGVVEPASQAALPSTSQAVSHPAPQLVVSQPPKQPEVTVMPVVEQRTAESRPAPADSVGGAAIDTIIVLDDDDMDEENEELMEGEYAVEEEAFEANAEYEGATIDDEEEGEEGEENEPEDYDQEEAYEDEEEADDMDDEDDEDDDDDDDDGNSGEMVMSDDEDDEEEEPGTIILDDDDEEEEQTIEQQTESQEEQQSRSIDQSIGILRVPRMQTGTSMPRAQQQLQPFLLASQVSQFEEDDGIVPSTPTLVIPKVTDQVAISSPQVPQSRFLFSSGLQSESATIAQSSLADLASQGGVDDTQMDIFDDNAAGCSIPTNPQSRTPPAISITEAPLQEEESGETTAPDTEASQSATNIATTDKVSQAETGRTGETVQDIGEGDTGDDVRIEGRSETPTASTSQEGAIEEDPEEGDGQNQDDKPDQPEPAAVRQKKIQRIVWDQPTAQRAKRGVRGARGVASSQRGAQHPGPVATQSAPIHAPSLMGIAPSGFQHQPQAAATRGSIQRGRGRPTRNRSRRSRPF